LLEGGQAVITGGLSFLCEGTLDRATAEVDQHEKTLAAVTVSSTIDQQYARINFFNLRRYTTVRGLSPTFSSILPAMGVTDHFRPGVVVMP
jgi:hypothetical protein